MFPKPRKGYNRKGWVPEITSEEMYEELLLHIQLMKDKFPDTNGRLGIVKTMDYYTYRKKQW
jgi:hypothetical protein